MQAASSGSTVFSTIGSAQTGISYDLDIWLPAGYAQSTITYPVIYAMDCEYRFATLRHVMEQRAAQAILVHVCAMGSDRRWVDFTMPGAQRYYKFIVAELVPWVERSYRAQSNRRTLSGHSLSAQFVLYALFMENPSSRIFQSFISEECSCWYDASKVFSQDLAQPLTMEQAMFEADHDLPVNLVMAGDTFGNERFLQTVYARLMARQYARLRATHTVYSLGHVPMDGPAFNDALEFIFDRP